jgi:uncharacterized protein (TIGR00251 family)
MTKNSAIKNVFRTSKAGLEFSVYLTPGASREEITGLLCRNGDVCIKIAIQARPVNNQANVSLIEFIVATFRVAKTKVLIKRGNTSRQKSLLIEDLCLDDVPAHVTDLIKTHEQHLFSQMTFLG